MYNLLFSNVKANELNQKVQNSIANHLIIFIDYSPDYLNLISSDAKYMQAVDNLYSLYKDTAWIINSLDQVFYGDDASKKHVFESKVDVKKLRSNFKHISDLRTIQGHTRATSDKMLTARCECWFNGIISKSKPVDVNDYQILLNTLEQYGDDIYNICNSFIDEVVKSPKKNEIIERWENIILSGYSCNQDIIKQAIYLYYYSQSSSPLSNTASEINSITSKIIISYYYYDYLQFIDLARKISVSKIQTKLVEEADKISDNRIEQLNQKLSLKLTCLDDILKLNSDEKTKVKNYFLTNDLQRLLNKALNDAVEKTLSIQDLIKRVLEKEQTTIDVLGHSLSKNRFKIP